MDPASVSASLPTVMDACMRTTETLDRAGSSDRAASIMIASISWETAVICASLIQMQNLLDQRSDDTCAQLKASPELCATVDTTLTGCMLVFAYLDDEFSSECEMSVARQSWKEDMMELLQNLLGQQTAFSLVIQALQMSSLSSTRKLLRSHRGNIERIAGRIQALRSSKPRVSCLVPDSVLAVHGKKTPDAEKSPAVGVTEVSFEDVFSASIANRTVLLDAGMRRSNSRWDSPSRKSVYDRGAARKRIRSFMDMKCVACQELLEDKMSGERIVVTACQHIYHESCLSLNTDAQGRKKSCPMCNEELHLKER